MSVFGVCLQDPMEPWGWEPLAIIEDDGANRRTPLRRVRREAEVDLTAMLTAESRQVYPGIWEDPTTGYHLSVQEFEIEDAL